MARTTIVQKERWKDIRGYEGLYQISNNGEVKSLGRQITLFGKGPKSRVMYRKDRILKNGIDNAGYKYVNLAKNGVNKTVSIHRLVAEAFLSNKKGLRDVNHKNGDKLDNRVCNLEWTTHSDNIKHSYDVLKRNRERQALRRKVMCQESGRIFRSIKEAATYCNVSTTTITACIKGKKRSINGTHWSYYDQ